MRAGKMEGQFRRWHPNGQLAEQVAMRAGQPDGISRAWFPDGSLKAEVRLENSRVITQTFWKEGEHEGNQMALAPAQSP
jgi:antitoxin component YwqK of YwqJK toxin-antitoxin module